MSVVGFVEAHDRVALRQQEIGRLLTWYPKTDDKINRTVREGFKEELHRAGGEARFHTFDGGDRDGFRFLQIIPTGDADGKIAHRDPIENCFTTF